ncbi:hypothetical protein DEJ50_13715 [Streptomyces venezuelae]|uniref:Uncharacterized protein n=2 Tax=Streptomyces venezuelae TaxID=54571 RepID=A0A5P2D0Y6_STRVZ|nr:hypothetical protein DEJ50_13715 [Streptomyces venezuelae]
MWAVSSNLSPGSPGEVELFSTPSGWHVYESTLRDLSRPGKYVANLDGAVKGSSLEGRVVFTVEKLQALNAGEVVTGISGDKIMDRSEFMKADAKRCDA